MTQNHVGGWLCVGLALCSVGVAGCPSDPQRTEYEDVDAGTPIAHQGDPRPAEPQEVDAGNPIEPERTADAILETVQRFYAAFNAHSFADADEFATDDWTLVDPFGGWAQGRDEVIEHVEWAHTRFLSKTTAALEGLSLSYATNDLAVVVAMVRVSPYTAPDGSVHDVERQLGTFVVVEHEGRWLLSETQHTITPAAHTVSETGVVPANRDGETQPEKERASEVRATVAWFRDLAKSHTFETVNDHATPDWNFIAPNGFWGRTRSESIEGVRFAYTSFLDGVTFTQDVSVRFVTEHVAIATTMESLSPYTDLSGVKYDNDHLRSTFVVVDRDGRWLLRHTHVTRISGT